MAKKSRTPPPPRRVQAPQRRDSSGRVVTGSPRRTARLLVLAALAIAAGVIAYVVFGRGGDGSSGRSTAAALRAAGCTTRDPKKQAPRHIPSLTLPKGTAYNSFPPSSGPHYEQPAPWNYYSIPVDAQTRLVHNLEHGGVVIQWGSQVSPATVQRLRTFWQDDPNGLVLAPLPKLGDSIALTAWGHVAKCARYDEPALAAFRDAYRGKGPEKIPVSALTPGS